MMAALIHLSVTEIALKEHMENASLLVSFWADAIPSLMPNVTDN